MLVTSTHDLSCGCLGGLGLAPDLGSVIFVNHPIYTLCFASVLVLNWIQITQTSFKGKDACDHIAGTSLNASNDSLYPTQLTIVL